MRATTAGTAALALGLMLIGPPRAAAGAPGTFVIAEAQAGYAFGGAFGEVPGGPGVRFTLGGGGRVAGSRVRLYGIASLSFAELRGAAVEPTRRVATDRRWTAWSLGVRVLAPVWRRLRLLGELSVGQVEVESRAIVNDGAEFYAARGDALVVEAGVGLQYRVMLHLSLGVRADLAVPTGLGGFDLIGALAGAAGGGPGFNATGYATFTVHL